jgi:hypothetical protein
MARAVPGFQAGGDEHDEPACWRELAESRGRQIRGAGRGDDPAKCYPTIQSSAGP